MANPDSDLVLAGTAAGGSTGVELLWVSPTGTTGPTDAHTTLTVVAEAWEGMGYCSLEGVTLGIDESWEEIGAYGVSGAVRKICKKSEHTVSVELIETNAAVLEVFHRLDVGTIAPDASGDFSILQGSVPVQRYSFVVDVVDDVNHVRHYYPACEVTDRKEQKIGSSSGISYSLTFTAYPGSDTYSRKSYYRIPALASS